MMKKYVKQMLYIRDMYLTISNDEKVCETNVIYKGYVLNNIK